MSNAESVLYRQTRPRQPNSLRQTSAHSLADREGDEDARKEPGLVLAHDGDECPREDEVDDQYDAEDRRAEPLEVGRWGGLYEIPACFETYVVRTTGASSKVTSWKLWMSNEKYGGRRVSVESIVCVEDGIRRYLLTVVWEVILSQYINPVVV